MTTRIIYSTEGQTGKMLAQAVNDVLEARAALERIKLLLDRAQTANPADWAAIAAELGGGITEQQAQDTWTIVATALDGHMNHDAVKVELARLDQG